MSLIITQGQGLDGYTAPPAPYYSAIYDSVAYPRAAVALRFDDCLANDYAVVYPLLLARHLVAGFATISSALGLAGHTTAAQMAEMQGHGMEILCHSRSHIDNLSGALDPLATWIAETVGAKQDLEALNFYVQSFVQPGVWANTWNLDRLAKYATTYGAVLEAVYAASEAYIAEEQAAGGSRALPYRYRHGVNHITCETLPISTVLSYVDAAIKWGAGCELLIHTGNLDQPGYLSSADVGTLLDYVQAKRDAGLIAVLTPTALTYARREIGGQHISILWDGSFAGQSVGTMAAGLGWDVTGSPQIVTGGRSGGNALQTDASNYARQWFRAETLRSLLFEGWAKSSSANTTARVLWRTYDSDQVTQYTAVDVVQSGITSSGWTRVQVTLGNDPRAWYGILMLTTNGAAPVIWSDCALYKV